MKGLGRPWSRVISYFRPTIFGSQYTLDFAVCPAIVGAGFVRTGSACTGSFGSRTLGSSPMSIFEEEIEDKIHLLEKKSFFNQPRTAYETVSELREYGWSASSLLVSKVLTNMAHNKQILKNSKDNRSYYLIKEAILTI